MQQSSLVLVSSMQHSSILQQAAPAFLPMAVFSLLVADTPATIATTIAVPKITFFMIVGFKGLTLIYFLLQK